VSHGEPPDDFAMRVERAMADVEEEMARVGADWDELDAALIGDAELDDEDPVIGLDVFTLLAALRALPDGAGTNAGLAALEPDDEATDR
jgi:hypothetical protein